MKSERRKQVASGPLAAARWILAGGTLALAFWASALGYDYVPPRVSHIEGSAAYEPAGDVDWAEVTLNLPLLSGDRVISHPDSRIEIELGYDNFLRLGENTDLVLRRTSDSEVEMDLAVGDLILRVNDSARFQVNLPTATVRVKKEGLYRFSVDEDGFSRVAVRKGEARVSNAARERKVKSGEELVVEHPQSSLQRVGYASREDDFDVWSDRRDAQFVSSLSAQYVGGRYAGVYDLDRYGEWRYVSDFGSTVWFPFPSSGWRPYLIGSWSWAPGWGWNWISFEPWGWLPYHYGRWAFYRDYGRWCWIPGGFSRWSPHVVDFYSGGGYVGWAPRGYFPGRRGRGNVTVINNNTNIVNVGGWDRLGPREGLTVVPEGQFRSRGGFDRVALDGPARRNVVEVLRPTTPEDLSPRPGRAGLRSNPVATAGVGGPRVVGVGREASAGSGGSVPANTLTPGNSGWSGVSRPFSTDSSQPVDSGVGRGRSPAAASPAAVVPAQRQRGESGGAATRATAPVTRPSGAAWTNRSRGAERPSTPAVSPAARDRAVSPPRSRNPVRTAPPARSSGSRSYSGRSVRPPTRVTPSRPSTRPSTRPRSVRPRTPSRPPASVSRPARTRSAPPARVVRPANRQRPPS